MTIRVIFAAGLSVGLAAAAFVAPAAAQFSPELTAVLTRDLARASDHPLTGRYGGSVLLAQSIKAFDELKLPSGAALGQSYDNDKKFSSMVTAQGKVTRSIYITPTGRSSLEVATNYFDNVAAKGFTPVFSVFWGCLRRLVHRTEIQLERSGGEGHRPEFRPAPRAHGQRRF